MRHRTSQTSRSQRSALLIIDMINRFDFPGGEKLARQAEGIAPNIAAPACLARAPALARDLLQRQFRPMAFGLSCRRTGASEGRQRARDRGAAAAGCGGLLHAEAEALCFLLDRTRPAAPLASQSRLVLCGVAGDGCVQATAIDAHMRDYEVLVASDGAASLIQERNVTALGTLSESGVARSKLTTTLLRG